MYSSIPQFQRKNWVFFTIEAEGTGTGVLAEQVAVNVSVVVVAHTFRSIQCEM